MTLPQLSIIIPAYNEARTLPELLARVRKVELDKEIILVDDGSTDATPDILRGYAWPELRLIRLSRNQGKGFAVRVGLAAARGEVVLIQDADLEYDPAEYPKLLAPILQGRADVVYGNRWHEPVRPSYRRYLWGGRLLTSLTNFLYTARLHDEPTGYKVFRRELIQSLSIRACGFDLCPEVTAKLLRLGYRIVEVPISYTPRSFAEGKKISWRDGLVAIWVLLTHRFSDKRGFLLPPKSRRNQEEATPPGKYLVILPTYNERENIVNLLRQILAQPIRVEVLVVDDNSPDGTGDEAERVAQSDPRVHVMHRAGKLGLGTAYRDGLTWALAHDYDFFFIMDSDFSHDPSYLPSLARCVQQCDVAIGSRYVPGGGTRNWGLRRIIFSRAANLLTRLILGLSTRDVTAGFRCFRRDALEKIRPAALRSRGYSIMEELSCRSARAHLRIREIPIVFTDRKAGRSKISIREALGGFITVLKLRFSP